MATDGKGLPQKLTAEELATWIPAAQAIKQAEAAYGEFDLAARTVFGRLCVGAIRSGADASGIDGAGHLSDVIEIHPQHWASISLPTKEDVLWRTGELLLLLPATRDVMGTVIEPSVFMRYFGVRLEPTGLKKLLAGAPAPPLPVAPPLSNPRGAGAPRKPWWDAFWIEMVCLQYAGDIGPDTTQADVVRLMLAWTSKNGHPLGETVAKDMARKLLAALKKTKVGN